MAPHVFSRSAALRYGWQTTKRNLGLAIGLGVAGALASFLVNGVAQATHRVAMLSTGFWIAAELVQLVITFAWIRFALTVHDERPVHVRDLLPDDLGGFLNYLGVSILYALAVALGLVLLVVPGIYLAIRYGFARLVVVDKKTDVIDAFKRSSALTHGERWSLFVLALALVGINLLGALLFGIGLLITIPITAFTVAYVYRRLEAHAAAPTETYPRPVAAPA